MNSGISSSPREQYRGLPLPGTATWLVVDDDMIVPDARAGHDWLGFTRGTPEGGRGKGLRTLENTALRRMSTVERGEHPVGVAL